MNIKAFSASISLLCSASLLTAEAVAYQYEVQASGLDGSIDGAGIRGDIEGYGLGFSVYFPAVDDTAGPLAEAAFQQRASSVSIDYFEDESLDTDDQTLSVISGRIVDAESGWSAGLAVSNLDVDGDETVNYRITMGKYLLENTELQIGIERVELESESLADDEDDVLNNADINIRHLSPSVGVAVALHYEFFEFQDGDEVENGNIYGGELTYYPADELGISVFYEELEGSGNLNSLGIAAEYFVTRAIAVSVGYTEAEVGAADSDAVTLGLRGRF